MRIWLFRSPCYRQEAWKLWLKGCYAFLHMTLTLLFGTDIDTPLRRYVEKNRPV